MIVLHYLASGTFNAVALTGTWYWYQELVLPGIIPVPAPGIGSSTCNIYKNVYATRYLAPTVISLGKARRGTLTVLVEKATRGARSRRRAVFPQKEKEKPGSEVPRVLVSSCSGHPPDTHMNTLPYGILALRAGRLVTEQFVCLSARVSSCWSISS